MNLLHSTLDRVRDTWAPISHTSTFRQTGEITPEDFVRAGDYLVYKFPSWQWSDAEPSKRVTYLPPGKQFLVTKGVPCHRRLDQYAGDAGADESVVESGRGGKGDDDGWLRTGGTETTDKAAVSTGDVRTVDEDGRMEDKVVDEDEIPDMEDEEDDEDAIIRDTSKRGDDSPLRTYTLYITYTPYYRTPRIYLSGYSSSSQPLPPAQMMEDIVGDYKDKTVTLEDFPFFQQGVKMASVHPCRHASVMKVLLDRAEGALRRRKEKMRSGLLKTGETGAGLEGLVDSTKNLNNKDKTKSKKEAGEDEWEVVSDEGEKESDEVAIRVDQYLVVFLKFISSVTPTIEHDFTMGI